MELAEALKLIIMNVGVDPVADTIIEDIQKEVKDTASYSYKAS